MTNEGPSQFIENDKMYKNYENYEKKPEFENFKNKSANFENRVHVKKKSLVYLWSFALFYLTLGAVIINQIEQNQEVSESKISWKTPDILRLTVVAPKWIRPIAFMNI